MKTFMMALTTTMLLFIVGCQPSPPAPVTIAAPLPVPPPIIAPSPPYIQPDPDYVIPRSARKLYRRGIGNCAPGQKWMKPYAKTIMVNRGGHLVRQTRAVPGRCV